MEDNHDHDHEKHRHTHDHSNLSGKKIFWVTVLNAIITVTEIIGGIFSGSLALLSDALHNLSDTIAIALSYFANCFAQKSRDEKRTYGYKRAEILAALVNATVLLVLSVLLIIEAIKRWQSPDTINGLMMIVVALVGLIANFISVFLLEKDSHNNLNIKSSYLHLMSDTVSSMGVLIGGVAIQLWGIVWIDPLITALISIYIIRETWQIIKKTVNILMQSAAPLNYEAIKTEIEKMEKVKSIYHVHTWMSDEKTVYFEAHIEMEDMPLSEVCLITDEIEYLLKEKEGIYHVTLQAEVDKCCDKRLFK